MSMNALALILLNHQYVTCFYVHVSMKIHVKLYIYMYTFCFLQQLLTNMFSDSFIEINKNQDVSIKFCHSNQNSAIQTNCRQFPSNQKIRLKMF